MSSVGAHLRELRARRGVSLGEISRETRVPLGYLEALEAEEFARLPAPVFVRGFIRAYCETLGESPDECIARYDDLRRAAAVRAPLSRRRRVAGPARGHVLVSLVLLVVLGTALAAVTRALQSGREGAGAGDARTGARSAAPPPVPPAPATGTTPRPATGGSVSAGPGGGAEAPPVVRSVPTEKSGIPPVAAPAPVERPASAAVVVREPDAPVVSASSPFRLTARASEPTWMRVRTEDGQHLGEETIQPGQVREWISNRRFAVRIGNAGGVKLELNGRVLPQLGRRGEIIERLVLPPPDAP